MAVQVFFSNTNKTATGVGKERIKAIGSNYIIEKPEQELTDLLSDILEEGETWRN